MRAGLIERLDLTRFDWMPSLRDFAELVQSAERERCAQEAKKLRAFACWQVGHELAPEKKKAADSLRGFSGRNLDRFKADRQ